MTARSSLDHPEILDRQVFHAGKVIFEEGDEGDCAYVIQSGAVDIVRDTDDGKVKLGRLRAGSILAKWR
jgi:CRP-like cAMP-binding protein